MTRDWFSVIDLGDGVHLIAEPGHVNSYLVHGASRALLFDTGLGLGNIRSVVEELTDLPVVVVNSHSHLDHRGGNQHFDTVLAHPDAAPGLAQAFTSGDFTWFGPYAARVAAAHARTRPDDDDYFHVHDQALRPRPAPTQATLDAWAVPACRPSGTVTDGDHVDLGGRSLNVIHCPGHSPDSIVLHEPDTGILLAGDVLVAGVSFAHLDGADPTHFRQSIARLETRTRGHRHRILLAHTMRYEMPSDFLDEVAGAWNTITAGTSPHRTWTDMFGNRTRRTDFRRFSITLPEVE